jgi:hypothetical protein
MKHELETLRRINSEKESISSGRGHRPKGKEWEEPGMEISSPLLFNVSGIYYDPEQEETVGTADHRSASERQ